VHARARAYWQRSGITLGVLTMVVPRAPKADQAGPMVKLLLNGSHCSAAHLGSGLILTAQHCTVMGVKGVKTDRGTDVDAETLWASPAYDVALVTTHAPLPAAAALLSCRLVRKGEPVIVSGNPQMPEFIETRGTVLSGMHTMAFRLASASWLGARGGAALPADSCRLARPPPDHGGGRYLFPSDQHRYHAPACASDRFLSGYHRRRLPYARRRA
jgi:hypothetical protein